MFGSPLKTSQGDGSPTPPKATAPPEARRTMNEILVCLVIVSTLRDVGHVIRKDAGAARVETFHAFRHTLCRQSSHQKPPSSIQCLVVETMVAVAKALCPMQRGKGTWSRDAGRVSTSAAIRVRRLAFKGALLEVFQAFCWGGSIVNGHVATQRLRTYSRPFAMQEEIEWSRNVL